VIAKLPRRQHSNIHAGSKVDVYLMGHPDRKFDGVVQSRAMDLSRGRNVPTACRISNDPELGPSLHTFSGSDFDTEPDPTLFRIGATALTIVR